MYINNTLNQTITNPGTTVMASFQIPTNGLYLFQWNIQVTYTSAFTYFYSNIAVSNLSSTAITPTISSVNWGQQMLGTVGGQFMTTNGSIIVGVTANNYYNLLFYVSGGGTVSAIGGVYYATRIA
jgi:hypothetical protein